MTYTTYRGNSYTYYTMEPEPIFGATATIIAREGHGLLVDTQFSKADAESIIGVARAQKINIEVIYISYSDPDYYFGAAQIKNAFPNAKVIATVNTIQRIQQTYSDKLKIWADVLKGKKPKTILIPEPVGNLISFAGQDFSIVGHDPAKQTVYNVEDKLLLGGILVATDSHLFMADTKTKDAQEGWIRSLDELISLKPQVVIPGHFKKGNHFLPENLTFTKNYIGSFIAAEQEATSSNDIIQKMQQAYPDLTTGSLEMSAKVVTGEQAWD